MNLFCHFEKQPLLFTHPVNIISCSRFEDLPAACARLERCLRAGLHVAGLISYEAGYAFEKRLRPLGGRPHFPLLHMGAYAGPARGRFPGQRSGGFELANLRLSISPGAYAERIAKIRDYIARGDVYQITYCLKLRFDFRGSPLGLWSRLYSNQPVPYAAYAETDRFTILSLSPERFIKKTGTRMITEPMKGTWPRGAHPAADRQARRDFARDPKNLAENVMIADLLRNDLGRVGRRIRAPKLFTITKYRTLYQMTSTVTGKVPAALSVWNLLAALFPSGSVTGAPKIRAMEIIRELEGEDRKIYTGAIGYITPARDMYFNVPIRTLLLEGARGEMGIGGGIVWDSTARGEWEEGLLKARFLTDFAAGHAGLGFQGKPVWDL